MTPEQEMYLVRIKSDFIVRVDTKYRRGQKEHGGDLREVGSLKLLDYAIDEAIDQVVYLLTLLESLVGAR